MNTSQYSIRMREEGAPRDQMPAGTVTPEGAAMHAYTASKDKSKVGRFGTGTIYPGKKPPLHPSREKRPGMPKQPSVGKQVPVDENDKDFLEGECV